MKKSLAGGVILMLGFAAGAANAEIDNGSFEKPPLPAEHVLIAETGDKFGGWKVVGEDGSIFLAGPEFELSGIAFPPQHKKQWVSLAGFSHTATGVERKVDTAPGSYRLVFYVGNLNNPGLGFGVDSTVKVFVDGVLRLTAVNSEGDASHFVWKKFTVNITATASRTTLAFINGDGLADGVNGLDHITLTPLP